LEKELIQTAYKHIRDRKTLYTLIDEAHLLDDCITGNTALPQEMKHVKNCSESMRENTRLKVLWEGIP
ncbi:MAG: hypothetical protein P8104_11160, partial [Gammaproteobacteria bacterium]